MNETETNTIPQTPEPAQTTATRRGSMSKPLFPLNPSTSADSSLPPKPAPVPVPAAPSALPHTEVSVTAAAPVPAAEPTPSPVAATPQVDVPPNVTPTEPQAATPPQVSQPNVHVIDPSARYLTTDGKEVSGKTFEWIQKQQRIADQKLSEAQKLSEIAKQAQSVKSQEELVAKIVEQTVERIAPRSSPLPTVTAPPLSEPTPFAEPKPVMAQGEFDDSPSYLDRVADWRERKLVHDTSQRVVESISPSLRQVVAASEQRQAEVAASAAAQDIARHNQHIASNVVVAEMQQLGFDMERMPVEAQQEALTRLQLAARSEGVDFGSTTERIHERDARLVVLRAFDDGWRGNATQPVSPPPQPPPPVNLSPGAQDLEQRLHAGLPPVARDNLPPPLVPDSYGNGATPSGAPQGVDGRRSPTSQRMQAFMSGKLPFRR